MIETLLSILMAVTMLGSETPADWACDRAWNSMTDEQRYEASIELKARSVGMTAEEFIFMSSVVEAESDRGYSDESQENRVLIALTIYNRMYSEDWPDTVTGVLNQSGQFSVVASGACWSVGRTNRSDAAIIEAHQRLARGNAPHVMYFNCIGYNGGFEAYGLVGDNYFMIA